VPPPKRRSGWLLEGQRCRQVSLAIVSSIKSAFTWHQLTDF